MKKNHCLDCGDRLRHRKGLLCRTCMVKRQDKLRRDIKLGLSPAEMARWPRTDL